MADFDFIKWAKAASFSRKTTSELTPQSDYIEEPALKIMSSDEVGSLDIMWGQWALLKVVLASLGNPSFSVASDDTEDKPPMPKQWLATDLPHHDVLETWWHSTSCGAPCTQLPHALTHPRRQPAGHSPMPGVAQPTSLPYHPGREEEGSTYY